jgi:hypothetical protein
MGGVGRWGEEIRQKRAPVGEIVKPTGAQLKAIIQSVQTQAASYFNTLGSDQQVQFVRLICANAQRRRMARNHGEYICRLFMLFDLIVGQKSKMLVRKLSSKCMYGDYFCPNFVHR